VTDDDQRAIGLAVYGAISMVPAIAPALIETARSGACASIKESVESFMKTNGRWVSAVILLGAGAYVAFNAWNNMP